MKQKTLLRSLAALLAITTVVFFACQKDNASLSSSNSSSNDNAKTKAAYNVPTLTCNGSTQRSIDLLVTAGATGAASGFSIQWMTAADFATYGWPVGCEGDGCASVAPSFCKASFSGNASLSRYNLVAGGSVSVSIGDLLFDNGASTGCPGPLECGTAYVFRTFAHGDSKLNQSHFGGNTTCSTLDCNDCGRQGYGHWKNNCAEITTVTGGNGLDLGTNHYTDEELCCILNENPSPGNGLIIVAHQLISAKLNGADAATTADGDAYIGSNIIPIGVTETCAGNGSIAFKKASTAAGIVAGLHHFNNTCE